MCTLYAVQDVSVICYNLTLTEPGMPTCNHQLMDCLRIYRLNRSSEQTRASYNINFLIDCEN